MAETTQHPDSGEEIPERRGGPGRREHDWAGPGRLSTTWAAIWAVIGGLVVLYLFLIAIDAVDPGDARAATIVVAVMAVAWLAHSYRRLWAGGFTARPDRERRGF
jgi:hypothetical protein